MGAEEAAGALRTHAIQPYLQSCPIAAQACPIAAACHQHFLREPPLKRSSGRASRLRGTGDSRQKHVLLIDRYQGAAANNSFWGHCGEFSLPVHVVHGPTTELGPTGSNPAYTRTAPLGLISIWIVIVLFVVLRAVAAWSRLLGDSWKYRVW
ncbi:hypothetical protein C8J57DRAFT_1375167 [Mycena rebaudengoi]|nr:hypothetical protein C8J57DRAFT_1375167 [Mycena rebaudengoi]